MAERTKYQVGRYPLVFHGLCDECSRRNGDAPVELRPGREEIRASSDDGDEDPDRDLTEDYW